MLVLLAIEGDRLLGAPVDGIDPRIGFVFQADAVFPWRSVLDNVAAGPLYRGRSKSAAYDEANEWLRRVGLDKFGKHYPHQLSGGMRKRVALAQTFINKPEILLMDEPFSALDMQTRTLMQDELLQLWGGAGSVVFRSCVRFDGASRYVEEGVRNRSAASARHIGGSLRPAFHRDFARYLA